MRILSYGHVKPKKKDCNYCGAVFEYVPRDIETHRAGTPYAKTFIRCPVCSNVIWVDEMLVKNEQYLTFQTPDRNHEIPIKVDGRFVNRTNDSAYTFRTIVSVGFDGPPLGDSLLNMIENCIQSYVEKTIPEMFDETNKANLGKIERTAAAITNVALSKITTRANVNKVQFIAICPTTITCEDV